MIKKTTFLLLSVLALATSAFAGKVTYAIEVTTPNKSGAGTDNFVDFTIAGPGGETAKTRLQGNQEIGTETHNDSLDDIGAPTAIWLRLHDDVPFSAGVKEKKAKGMNVAVVVDYDSQVEESNEENEFFKKAAKVKKGGKKNEKTKGKKKGKKRKKNKNR